MWSGGCHAKDGKPTIFKLLTNIARCQKPGLLKKLFQISAKEPRDIQDSVLCMRIGERHLSFAILHRHSGVIHDLSYYSIDNPDIEVFNALPVLQPEIKRNISAVNVAFDFPQFILLPEDESIRVNSNQLITSLFPPGEIPVVLEDRIIKPGLVNTYWIPQRIHQWIAEQFPAAQLFHQHSIHFSLASRHAATGMYIDFRRESFSLMAVRDGEPLLLQDFEYSTPGDVLYYLLKVCEQFGFSQQDVHLLVSGLVDRQSGLYQALYQYFIQIEFRMTKWDLPSGQYPAHFFTSLNDLALCGS